MICSTVSAPKPKTRSANSSGWRWPMSASMCPPCKGFCAGWSAGDTEVKRDFAARRRDEVRILTVHGAKGLEAPIVFLPDTMAVPDQKQSLLWTEAEGLPLWKPPGDHLAPFYVREKKAWRERQLQEYRRLLYVGLTRARDRLYICGWQTLRPPPELCWHALCRGGLGGHAQSFDFDTKTLIGDDGWCGQGLRLEGAQTAPPVREPIVETASRRGVAGMGERTAAGRARPAAAVVPVAPGRRRAAIGVAAAARRPRPVQARAPGPSAIAEPARIAACPSAEAAARGFLASPSHGLAVDEQDEIRQETLAVLDHPGFAALFGPDSQAEVPLVGLVDGHALSGQIDRLVVAADHVLIVDYKTMRAVPATEAEVAPIYLRQLAIYRAALARIYPGRDVRCALLWTQGPLLMPISFEKLAGQPA